VVVAISPTYPNHTISFLAPADKIEGIVKKSINFAKKLKAKHHPIEFSKSVDIRVAKKGISVKIGKSG
jgi:uncharacterized alkaline shock family protein YloU